MKVAWLITEALPLIETALQADPRWYASVQALVGWPLGAPGAVAPGVADDPDTNWICLDPMSERFAFGGLAKTIELQDAVFLGKRERPGLVPTFANVEERERTN
jgi:hypothetical protein